MTYDQVKESIDPSKKKKDLRKVLICPGRDIRVESAFEINVVENVTELTTLLGNNAAALSISDLRVTKLLVEYADLFEVEPVLLSGVPGCDYTPAYEQLTWSLERTGYDALVIEVGSEERMNALKEAERPKMAGGKPVPNKRQDVVDMRVPDDFDVEDGAEYD